MSFSNGEGSGGTKMKGLLVTLVVCGAIGGAFWYNNLRTPAPKPAPPAAIVAPTPPLAPKPSASATPGTKAEKGSKAAKDKK